VPSLLKNSVDEENRAALFNHVRKRVGILISVRMTPMAAFQSATKNPAEF
jgi:hypothetical protein